MTEGNYVIFDDTRTQSIPDGAPVDAGARYPRLLGFKIPVASTAAKRMPERVAVPRLPIRRRVASERRGHVLVNPGAA